MRPPRSVRSPNACARRLAGLLVVCVAVASPREVSGASGEKVRITYHARPGCPAEDVFLSAVRARIGTDWEATPAAPVRAMDVTIDVDEGRSMARLTFVDDEGRTASRSVSGATCAEAVTGIALATALAIESQVADAANDASRAAPSSVPAAPPPADPAESAAVATALPASPALREPAPAHAAAIGASPGSPWHAELGAAAVVMSGVGPAPAFGARLLGGIEWHHGANLRLGIDYAATVPTLVREYGGVMVQTYELGARVSGCPFAFELGARVRVLPCAGIAAGIIHAETRPSAGVSVTGSGNPAFVALFAELRLDVQFGAVFVEAGGELRFVVDNPGFALDPPDDRQSLYQAPLVAVSGSLGLGLRL